MDGNGRWATQSGLPRVAGHRAGVAAVRRVVEHAPALGIWWLTLYAFSSDNWRRPADEVESIFWLMRAYLRLETERLRQHGARLEIIDGAIVCPICCCARSAKQKTLPPRAVAFICGSP
jgi:undecaprenyl diphosphate synthase